MKQIKLELYTLFLLGLGLTAQAQQAITATGGNALGSGGTVDYSVGQIVYTTLPGTTGSVAQGVQQPYEISIVSGFEENQISLTIEAYPNPTADYIMLNLGNFQSSTLKFQLFDQIGKLIVSRKINTTTETIRMENLPEAIYFLKVINNNKELKTFKIIKN